jgi:hypothetical protein
VSETERERAIGTLVLAFTADPFVRWIYPEASQYLSRFPEALQAFGGAAFSHGGAWRLSDFAAGALWLPPGIEPGGDANLALFQATVDSRKFNDLLGVFGQMEEAHPAMPWTVFTHTSRAARVPCSERASSGFPPDVRQAAQVIAVKFPRIEL